MGHPAGATEPCLTWKQNRTHPASQVCGAWQEHGSKGDTHRGRMSSQHPNTRTVLPPDACQAPPQDCPLPAPVMYKVRCHLRKHWRRWHAGPRSPRLTPPLSGRCVLIFQPAFPVQWCLFTAGRISQLQRSAIICSLGHSFIQDVLTECLLWVRHWAAFWACKAESGPVFVFIGTEVEGKTHR